MSQPESILAHETPAEKYYRRNRYQLVVRVPKKVYDRARAAGVPHSILEAAATAALVAATETAERRLAVIATGLVAPAGANPESD